MEPVYGALHLAHIIKQHVVLERKTALELTFDILVRVRRQRNWSLFRQNRSNMSSTERVKKNRIVGRTVCGVLNEIDRTKRK